ncbi:MAG: urease accessory UreF family protein [Myxococcota bacterium]
MSLGLDPQLGRLLQLASATLPIGTYAYSDGLETAVERGWVTDEEETLAWLTGRLYHQLARVDLPILARLYDGGDITLWTQRLRAMRDSAEARYADRSMGQALLRLLGDLGLEEANPWRTAPTACPALGFALAGRAWALDREVLLGAYAWSYGEGQVAAAVKLVPLGQTAGQRILSRWGALLPEVVSTSLDLKDDELGTCAPHAAIASAWHEHQTVRLFRS